MFDVRHSLHCSALLFVILAEFLIFPSFFFALTCLKQKRLIIITLFCAWYKLARFLADPQLKLPGPCSAQGKRSPGPNYWLLAFVKCSKWLTGIDADPTALLWCGDEIRLRFGDFFVFLAQAIVFGENTHNVTSPWRNFRINYRNLSRIRLPKMCSVVREELCKLWWDSSVYRDTAYCWALN